MEGQLNALYKIFWYLKCEISHGKNPNVGSLVYDSYQTEFNDRLFTQSTQDQWNDFILMLRSCSRQRYQNQ